MRPLQPLLAVLADQHDGVGGREADVLPDALEPVDVDHRHEDTDQFAVRLTHGPRHGEELDPGQAAMDRPVEAGRKAAALEMDAEVVAIGQVAIGQRLGLGHGRHDVALGIEEDEIGQQVGRHLMLGIELDAADVAVRPHAVARLVEGVFDHEQRRPELVGDGAGELLDMGLTRSARGIVELAQHQVGEGHDEEDDDKADQTDHPAFTARGGQDCVDDRPRESDHSGPDPAHEAKKPRAG